jgi:hypothetical protein
LAVFSFKEEAGRPRTPEISGTSTKPSAVQDRAFLFFAEVFS